MNSVYQIGPFRLDPAAGALTRAGVAVPLGGRAVAVLAALVERPNEFVPKARILDVAWPGVVVEDANLAVQISSIRRALAEAPGGEHWIETLARRGYRFVGPVAIVGDAFAQPSSGEARRSNLPGPLTSFVGRERELVEIKRLLRSARLVTLVGVGGIGKTRLALQVAAELPSAAYRDGVWMVDLAPLTDPALVASSAAQVLGLGESTGEGVAETLARKARGRQLLLILDNCEHVLGQAANLADALLRAAGDLAILATSRELLHVAGEQGYPLATMSLPESATDLEAVARSEAVQLFVERAQEQLPAFALSESCAPAVAELCANLDGIPLAIELAAARIRTLSIEQINARLDDRFRLLAQSPGNVSPRQKTLGATLDWSHDLLTEKQRTVLRRLGVFAGGFCLDAASEVALGGKGDEPEASELLSQLMARSLVMSEVGDAGARYRLLETTRVYALEKLAAAGETALISRRHAAYFRDLFENAFTDWFRMPDAAWRNIYPTELDNVRRALDWALRGDGDAPLGAALAGSAALMWQMLGLFVEGRQWIELALSRSEALASPREEARLRLAQGILFNASSPLQSAASLEGAIGVFRKLDDPLALGYALVLTAAQLVQMGRLEESSQALAEAWPLVERTGLPKLRGSYFNASGQRKTLAGDIVGGRTDIEKALSLCIESGAEYAAPATLLGDLTWMLGDLDAAAAAFGEVVAMMRRSTLSRRAALGWALANLASVRTERGELDEALAAAREGLPLLAEGGGLAWKFMDHLASRAARVGRTADAARLGGFADSAHAARGAAREPNEARVRERLQRLLREKLEPDTLERLRAEGANMSEEEACRLALEG
ncbi:MAG TPA: winged helix-turn-helix domain-containing protein [Casimicrobiaceae bacterium]|nr:winged helix-turn-helix domain-containing protein [Casimicrobiaceae bacterium]